MEAWRPVVGYEGEYQVSNLGRVMSLKNNVPKLLRSRVNRRGYVQICLCKDNQKRYFSVHKLVLTAFVSERPPGMVINHKDGNKANNALSNLEWVTQAENIDHSHNVLLNGYSTPPTYFGENHPGARYTVEQIREIRRLHAEGVSASKLATRFGGAKSTIKRIFNNETWKDV